jgi:hypothetical protein
LVVHGPSADDCAIWIGAIGGEGPVLAESRRRGLPGARAPSPGPSEPALPTTKMLAASRCEFARLKPLDFHTLWVTTVTSAEAMSVENLTAAAEKKFE